MVIITEYYTATEYGPVKHVAAASETGHATNIAGIAVNEVNSLARDFCDLSNIIIVFLAGLYGIAIAATASYRWPELWWLLTLTVR